MPIPTAARTVHRCAHPIPPTLPSSSKPVGGFRPCRPSAAPALDGRQGEQKEIGVPAATYCHRARSSPLGRARWRPPRRCVTPPRRALSLSSGGLQGIAVMVANAPQRIDIGHAASGVAVLTGDSTTPSPHRGTVANRLHGFHRTPALSSHRLLGGLFLIWIRSRGRHGSRHNATMVGRTAQTPSGGAGLAVGRRGRLAWESATSQSLAEFTNGTVHTVRMAAPAQEMPTCRQRANSRSPAFRRKNWTSAPAPARHSDSTAVHGPLEPQSGAHAGGDGARAG